MSDVELSRYTAGSEAITVKPTHIHREPSPRATPLGVAHKIRDLAEGLYTTPVGREIALMFARGYVDKEGHSIHRPDLQRSNMLTATSLLNRGKSDPEKFGQNLSLRVAAAIIKRVYPRDVYEAIASRRPNTHSLRRTASAATADIANKFRAVYEESVAILSPSADDIDEEGTVAFFSAPVETLLADLTYVRGRARARTIRRVVPEKLLAEDEVYPIDLVRVNEAYQLSQEFQADRLRDVSDVLKMPPGSIVARTFRRYLRVFLTTDGAPISVVSAHTMGRYYESVSRLARLWDVEEEPRRIVKMKDGHLELVPHDL